jgi:hypothetical protein
VTPHKDGYGNDPPPDLYNYSDSFGLLLNVKRGTTLPTTDTGGAILGATGSVTSTVSFEGNDLGSFGLDTQSIAVVPLGAPIGTWGGTSQVQAKVQDTWYLNASQRYANLRVRAHWKVIGELGADIIGNDDPFGSLISSGASANLYFYGSGVKPGLHADYRYYSLAPEQNDYTPPPSEILLDMVFHNGVGSPFNFQVSSEANANVAYGDYALKHPSGGYAISSAHFGHTFTWGGIDDVSDADTGEEITDWNLTSDSGFDWIHPDTVPEPVSTILALPAITLLIPVRCRRAG